MRAAASDKRSGASSAPGGSGYAMTMSDWNGEYEDDCDEPIMEVRFPGRSEVARIPLREWKAFTAMAAELGMTVDDALRKAFRDGLSAEAEDHARGLGPNRVRMDPGPRRNP